MKNKNVYLLGILFVVIIFIVGYAVFNTNSKVYNISTIKNLKESDIKSKYVFSKDIVATDIEGDFNTTYKIELDLYKGNIFQIKTKVGEQSSGENCYGTYEIKNSVITLNRKTIVDLDNNYIDISDSSDYNLIDAFNISNDKKTLTTKVYNGIDTTYTSIKYFNDSVILKKK